MEGNSLLRESSKTNKTKAFSIRSGIRNILPIASVTAAFVVIRIYQLNKTQTPLISIPIYPTINQPSSGVLEIEGCEDGLHEFDNIYPNIDTTLLKSLKLRYLVIDAASFSRSLQNCSSLESLTLEDNWIDGDFTRVYLPSLKKFIYHQYSNGKTDYYKQQNILKNILFFDKDPNKTWSLTADLLNLEMTIEVKNAGTKLVGIDPSTGEININTHYCEDILKSFHPLKASFNLTTVSLHWCSLGTPVIQMLQKVGASITSLFLNNAMPSTSSQLGDLLIALPNLVELHIVSSNYTSSLQLNASMLPSTLTTLSLSNIDVTHDPRSHEGTSVKTISLDKHVSESLLDDFHLIFPNIEEVAFFNIPKTIAQNFTQTILNQLSPLGFVVTEFPETAVLHLNMNQTLVPGNSFVLRKAINGYNNTRLSPFRKHLLRYKYLGFDKIDSYTDYVTWDAVA